MFIRTVLVSVVIALCSSTSLEASINKAWDNPPNAVYQPTLLLAATRSKARRENRQDDRGRQDDREERRDCRDEEGAVGKDKRDCKQDSRRGEDDKDEKDEKDGK